MRTIQKWVVSRYGLIKDQLHFLRIILILHFSMQRLASLMEEKLLEEVCVSV